MKIRRIRQVLSYGLIHSGQIAAAEKRGAGFRLKVFFDILRCFFAYRMWSSQYLAEGFHRLSLDERKEIGARCREAGRRRDAWQKDFEANRRFLVKYGNIRYEIGSRRERRNKAYARRFNAGKNLFVEHDVNISRQHYLEGAIKIGNNVLLAKHVFIDYSGQLRIEDDVKLANGVIIETHHRDLAAKDEGRDVNIPTSLVIREGAYIGSRAIILSSCNYIGLHARIGAGAVVVRDVPDYAVAVGVPAKVVKYIAPRGDKHLP